MGVLAAVVLVGVGAVVFIATRSDGPTPPSATEDGRAYVDAMVDGTPADAGLSADEVRCMATHVVDQVGIEALQAAGITLASVRAAGDIDVTGLLTQAEASTLASEVADCIDWGDMVAAQLDGEDLGISTQQAHCIGDAIGDSDLIRDVFAQGFMGAGAGASQESARALGEDVVACIDFGALVATAMADAGVPIDDAQAACIGAGMNSSVFLREMFARQFTGISAVEQPEPPSVSVPPGGVSAVLSGIVQDLFGTTDAAMNEALTLEMTGVFSDCGIDLG